MKSFLKRKAAVVISVIAKENLGFRFIILFLVSLFAASIMLAVSYSLTAEVGSVLAIVAEGAGDLAFFSLAIGLILQLISSGNKGRGIRD
jgi:hypothetical protein